MMTKLGTANIICDRCSKPAAEGTNPPLCSEHNGLQKKGVEENITLREAEKLFTTQISEE